MKQYKLEDLGDIITGKTPSTKNKSNFGNDYMFITPNELDKSFPISNTERKVSKKGLAEVSNQTLKNKSVLVDCIGSNLGDVGFVDKVCVTNQQINSITNFKDFVNPYYIYFWFKDKKNYLQKIAGGTSVPIVNKTVFSNISINLPSKQKQDEIIDKILILKRKMENNKELINQFDKYIYLIFKKLFIKFDIDDSKDFIKKKNKKIPKNWEIVKLSKLVSYEKGISYTSNDIKDDDGIPMINLNSFDKNGGFKIEGLKFYSGSNYNNLLKPYDLIIACTDVTRNGDILGSPIIIPDIYSKKYVASCDVTSINLKSDKISKWFLKGLFSQEIYNKKAKGFSSGTNVLHLDVEGFLDDDIVVPTSNYLKKYDRLVSNFEKKKSLLYRENNYLQFLSEILIYKLIN